MSVDQGAYRLRFEWGAAGAAAVARGADVVVLVDVLSFTTTVSVAVDAGVSVLPHPWDDAGAQTLARDRDAVLAVGRSQAGPGRLSLSPASIRAAAALPQRLVLPSPNGSALAHDLAGRPRRASRRACATRPPWRPGWRADTVPRAPPSP